MVSVEWQDTVTKQIVPLNHLAILLFEFVLLIYSKREFIELCESSGFGFSDTRYFNEGLFEFIASGVFVVRNGVRRRAHRGETERDLLDALDKEFRDAIQNGGMSDLEAKALARELEVSIEEYESAALHDLSKLVVTKIFDKPEGSLPGDSTMTSKLNRGIEFRLQATAEAVDELFKRFEPIS